MVKAKKDAAQARREADEKRRKDMADRARRQVLGVNDDVYQARTQ